MPIFGSRGDLPIVSTWELDTLVFYYPAQTDLPIVVRMFSRRKNRSRVGGLAFTTRSTH